MEIHLSRGLFPTETGPLLAILLGGLLAVKLKPRSGAARISLKSVRRDEALAGAFLVKGRFRRGDNKRGPIEALSTWYRTLNYPFIGL